MTLDTTDGAPGTAAFFAPLTEAERVSKKPNMPDRVRFVTALQFDQRPRPARAGIDRPPRS